MITPQILSPNIQIPSAKLKDVCNLLEKHFGKEWRNLPHLKYYLDIENKPQLAGQLDMEINTDLCEHGFKDTTKHI